VNTVNSRYDRDSAVSVRIIVRRHITFNANNCGTLVLSESGLTEGDCLVVSGERDGALCMEMQKKRKTLLHGAL